MQNNLSRRDAIKLMGISPVTATLLVSANSSSSEASTDEIGKILIVADGAGAIMVLSSLSRAIKKPDITIIAPNEVHLYQLGQVLVGAGEMKEEDLLLDNNNYINQDEVTWIKEEVKTFDPDYHRVFTRSGEVVKYDVLVIAAGIQYHYEKIDGLTKEDIGHNGITSVYLSDL